MDVHPFTQGQEAAWDRFAEQSDDAWFWHTTDWMAYTEALAPQRAGENLSFTIQDASGAAAICPVRLETWEGLRSFAYAGDPLPSPALRNGLSRAQRERVWALYVARLRALARERDVAYGSVKVPSVAPSYLMSPRPFANPLLRRGFIDISRLTQVLDLREPIDVLWAQVRKGHKADIKRAARSCAVTVWDHETLSEATFRAYQTLHAKDAGRMTRSQRTFDLMLSWVRRRRAVLVEASHHGTPIAFCLLLLFRAQAYYGSSCKDPDALAVGASHLSQWESLRWLKAHGFLFYDLGLQQFGPLWFEVPSEKDLNISRFKRAFGGYTVPLVTAECYFSAAYLEQAFTRRMHAYLERQVEAVALDGSV